MTHIPDGKEELLAHEAAFSKLLRPFLKNVATRAGQATAPTTANDLLHKLDHLESLRSAALPKQDRPSREELATKVVPIEPTLEMQRAGYEALKLFFPEAGAPIGHYRIYEAMIAVAPRFASKPADDGVREALRDIANWRRDTLGMRPRAEGRATDEDEAFDRGVRMAFHRCADRAEAALLQNPKPGDAQ
jgi:hypothetical protein